MVQGNVLGMSQPAVVVAQPVASAMSGIEMAVPAGEYPPLIEMTRRFEVELRITGTTVQVVDQACKQLGVNTAGLSLTQKAERAYDAIFRPRSDLTPEVSDLIIRHAASSEAWGKLLAVFFAVKLVVCLSRARKRAYAPGGDGARAAQASFERNVRQRV